GRHRVRGTDGRRAPRPPRAHDHRRRRRPLGSRTVSSPSPAALVADIEARLRPLEIELAEAWWESNTKSSPEAEARRTAAELARRELLADPVLFGAVTNAREHLVTDTDPLVRRQLDVLYDAFVPHQVP